MTHRRYIVITPVRDEVGHIEKTILSMARQTILPVSWIIVDDGSTDGTADVLDRYAAKIRWIHVIHRENRGYRANGGGVMQAFHAGYRSLSDSRWDFVVKLDGDLSFSEDYFERCFDIFEDDVKLGIGGGSIYVLENDNLIPECTDDPPFHVRGATKIYRRSCWEQISPLTEAPGWDTIDEVKANLYGWTTRTFREVTLVQHKPTGGADGVWRDAFKNGRANYVTGYHPLFMVAKCLRRASDKPLFLKALAMFMGFCSGYAQGVPQVPDKKAIDYLRKQQIRRLLLQRSIYG